jgi:hypothetical protein
MAHLDGWILRYMPTINKGRITIHVDGKRTEHDLDASAVAAVGSILGAGSGDVRVFTDKLTGEIAIGRASGSLDPATE